MMANTIPEVQPTKATIRGSRRGPLAEIQPGEQHAGDPTSPEQLSPTASRMRRSRARRQRGEAVVSLEIGPAVIVNLISLGWLAEPEHADRGAIARAVADLVERAILARVNPLTGSQGRTRPISVPVRSALAMSATTRS